nr:unnamed protein product [Spirometra erinaceieuropaei]
MGLFGQMRIHEVCIDRTPDTPTTSNTSTVHTPTLAPTICVTTTIITTITDCSVADVDTADFSCPHCPRTFTSRIGLVGHLRILRTETGEPVPGASTFVYSATCESTRAELTATSTHPPRRTPHPIHHLAHPPTTPKPTSTAPTLPPLTPPCPPPLRTSLPQRRPLRRLSPTTITTAEPDTTTGTTPATSIIRREGQDYICPHCDRTFTSRIGLVGHLRIHRTETGEPVSGAPTYTHSTRLHCPHCPRSFMHRMGLFGHMRIHKSGVDHISDTPTTSSTSTTPSPRLAPSPCAPITTIATTITITATTITTATAAAAATTTTTTTTTITVSSVADINAAHFTCPHCARTFTSRIGLVGHLRIHRTETGKLVPGAPTYTHQARLNFPHSPRTFRHRMGLFGHMRIHDDLR